MAALHLLPGGDGFQRTTEATQGPGSRQQLAQPRARVVTDAGCSTSSCSARAASRRPRSASAAPW